MALGTICGHVKSLGSAPGIIWVDAHADINTPETTWSGNLHGQPVSFMLEELKDETIQLAGFDWVQPVIKDGFQTITDRNSKMFYNGSPSKNPDIKTPPVAKNE